MRILFITATRIGDAVMSTGILHHLTIKYPQAELTIACGPLAASLFSAVPRLDEIIILDKKPWGAHWFSLWLQVRKSNWDLIIDLRRSLISYCVPTKDRVRLGSDDKTTHRVELFSELFGLNPAAAPVIWTAQDHKTEAASLIPGTGPLIAIAPIAARPEKTWPKEKFLTLVNVIAGDGGLLPQSGLLLVGAEEDRSELEAFAERCALKTVYTLIGCSDLLIVYEALARASVIVANDSGMAHLAAATGQPTIAVFGPTDPGLYRPWGSRAAVVQAPNSDCGREISGLEVEPVVQAAKSLLN